LQWDTPNSPLFISAAELARIQSSVTLLDARNKFPGHIPGAVSTPWTDFVAPGGQTGLLLAVNTLQARLRNKGVRNDKPVVVYGDWQHGWGEEGRIFWMLHYLNHTNVRVLYGGLDAWKMNGGTVDNNMPTAVLGNFVADPIDSRRTTGDELWSLIQSGSQSLLLLDTREEKEYNGAKLYDETRGGHLPRAKLYTWDKVFGADGGNLKSVDDLRKDFSELGATDSSVIVGYCTGGIRSGFLYLVLLYSGYSSPSNYDGSFWEWSANSTYAVSNGAGSTSASFLPLALAFAAVAVHALGSANGAALQSEDDDEEEKQARR
jgi:thiosulfate/3-mercaptopyruvate sulfurtransferase